MLEIRNVKDQNSLNRRTLAGQKRQNWLRKRSASKCVKHVQTSSLKLAVGQASAPEICSVYGDQLPGILRTDHPIYSTCLKSVTMIYNIYIHAVSIYGLYIHTQFYICIIHLLFYCLFMFVRRKSIFRNLTDEVWKLSVVGSPSSSCKLFGTNEQQ